MIRVKQVETKEELDFAFDIRKKVFVEEQGVSKEIEYDGNDTEAVHVLAYKDNKPIGCARVILMKEEAKIGRVAVLKTFRKMGIGKQLCELLMEIAKKDGAKFVYLHAQASAKEFYENIGFSVLGNEFYEAGIPHYKMAKTL